MDDREVAERALEVIRSKVAARLRLERVPALPATAYDFDAAGWLIFRIDTGSPRCGGDESVAFDPVTLDVRFLGVLGE